MEARIGIVVLLSALLGACSPLDVAEPTGTPPYTTQSARTAPPTIQSTPIFRSLLLTGHTERVTQLTWSPDGRILASAATGQGDLAIRLWAAKGRLLATLNGHSAPILSLAWSPDGRMLASGSADQTVRLWNRAGSAGRTLHAERGSVWAVAWSPAGSMFASASDDKTIRLWYLPNPP